MNRTISPRQLVVLCAIAMLSPFLRLVPGSVTALAGKAGWVSAGLSIVPAAVLAGMLGKFSTKDGLKVVILRVFGRFWGCVVLLLWAVWLVFHSGFVLRSGADRFVDTIYPEGGFAMMILGTGLLCAIAAMGHIKPLARAARLFLPMMLFVIVLVIAFSLKDVEPTFLLPIRREQLPEILAGVPMAAEALSVALLLGAFGAEYVQPGGKLPGLWPLLIAATVLNVLVCLVAIGNLGSVYTGSLEYPGFILARDLRILSGVERVESLIVGLWLLPDFVLVTAELVLAGDFVITVIQTGKTPITEREPPFLSDVANEPDAGAKRRDAGSASPTVRKCCIAVLSLGSVLLAFRMVPNGQSLREVSTRIVPLFQLLWAYGFVPVLYVVGKLRRKF